MTLKILDTLTKQKRFFNPIEPGIVRIFVCGPTVYDVSHIGHAKTYTQFDFIARYLQTKGYQVKYLQNITDIDDKIIARANELGVTPRALALKYEALFLEDMKRLGNTSVDSYARATDHIDAIVEQVQQLIDKGFAYKLEDGWYMDASKLGDYGKLAGRSDIKFEDAVSSIDDNASKKNVADFALWKFHKPGEPFWKTSLGAGRPGWHIEDTAITEAFFGPQYDIHGGAIDLIFPHHENEIAQMEAASGLKPMVRYWMHTGLVRVGKAKMGKSNKNFVTIGDMLKRTDVRTLRYVFLSHHYRSSIELNDESVRNAKLARRRVETFYARIEPSRTESGRTLSAIESYRRKFYDRLDDDFDTPGALGALFELIKELNRQGRSGKTAAQFLDDVNHLFGTFDFSEREAHLAEDVRAAIKQRETLRREGRFSEADKIRDDLDRKGVLLRDTPEGTMWEAKT